MIFAPIKGYYFVVSLPLCNLKGLDYVTALWKVGERARTWEGNREGTVGTHPKWRTARGQEPSKVVQRAALCSPSLHSLSDHRMDDDDDDDDEEEFHSLPFFCTITAATAHGRISLIVNLTSSV